MFASASVFLWRVFEVFAVAVRYDGSSAGFELLDHTADRLSRRIRAALFEIRSRAVSDPSWIPAEPLRDNSFSVTVLLHTHTHTHTHACISVTAEAHDSSSAASGPRADRPVAEERQTAVFPAERLLFRVQVGEGDAWSSCRGGLVS